MPFVIIIPLLYNYVVIMKILLPICRWKMLENLYCISSQERLWNIDFRKISKVSKKIQKMRTQQKTMETMGTRKKNQHKHTQGCIKDLRGSTSSLHTRTMTRSTFTNCWCYHNNNGNNTTRNWIILLNIISMKKGITQHNLYWGAALALFKEIQALGWLNFVTGANLLWLVSPMIQ